MLEHAKWQRLENLFEFQNEMTIRAILRVFYLIFLIRMKICERKRKWGWMLNFQIENGNGLSLLAFFLSELCMEFEIQSKFKIIERPRESHVILQRWSKKTQRTTFCVDVDSIPAKAVLISLTPSQFQLNWWISFVSALKISDWKSRFTMKLRIPGQKIEFIGEVRD